MRLIRTAAAAASIALVGSAVAIGGAGAQTPGVGTASTVTRALTLQLGTDGSLLGLTLLDDSGRATIDPSVGAPEALSRLSALGVSSSVVPALNVAVPASPIESRTPGGQPSVEYPGAALPTPGALLSGNVNPASLTSSLVDGVAKSGLTSEISNLKLGGGLLSAASVKSLLGTTGNPANAEATRSVAVGPVTVLDLSALLEGIGIPLGELPVATVTALVDQLKAVVGNVPVGTVTSLVDDLTTQQASLEALAPTATVTQPIVDDLAADLPVVGGLLGGGLVGTTSGIPVPEVGTTTVTELLDQVTGLLEGVLGSAVAALDGIALLRLEGLEVGIATKAAETVDASAASITGTIGRVNVGGIALPGLDLTSAASQLTGLTNQVNDQIAGVLKIVDLGLGDLVKVSVLDQAKSVTATGGYVRSQADVTGLTAAVTPPAALTSIVSGILGTTGVGSILGSAQALTPMQQLDGLLNLTGTVSALSQGAVVKVADLRGAAEFTAAAAPVEAPGGTLPRTGGPAALGLLGLLFAAMAAGVIRLLHNADRRGATGL